MEKRLLLAFVLSFLVLAIWGRLFPTSPPIPPPAVVADDEEPVEIKSAPPPPALAPQTELAAIEEETVLETEKLKIILSNIGGHIKSIELVEYSEILPVTGIVRIPGFEQSAFYLDNRTASTARYIYDGLDVRIIKEYLINPQTYLFDISVNLYYKEEMSSLDINKINLFSLDTSKLDKKLQKSRDLSLIEYAALINDKISAKGNIVKYSSRDDKFTFGGIKNINETGKLDWIGFRDRYFTFILAPQFTNMGYDIYKANDSLLDFFLHTKNKSMNQFIFNAYCGPQNLETLKESGHNFQKMMRFSGWGLLDFVAKGIYMILNFIHNIIPNWGLCIIFLGILIYGLTYPLTLKSMASMKKMQAIQPQIAKLKEKYKNDHQKLSKEQMELFKEHKINPMGGCFPILLQMPVFIGFYQVLWRSVMLKGANFLWIKDLSEPDRLIVFSQQYPFIGNELNILPFFMGVIMFFQQKISSKNMNITDPAQASQQKMMMFFLPVMMLFIFYHAASGLTLYFTFFYLLTIFTQWRISKAKN